MKCFVFAYLLLVATVFADAGLRFDFNGAVGQNGMAVGNVRFEDNAEIVVSNRARVEIKAGDSLRSDGGSLEMKIRSIDWNGADNTHKYFFYARLNNGKDVVFLRKDANGDLVLAMGRLPHSLDIASASATFWKKGETHTIGASWDDKSIALFVDGVKVGSRARTIKDLNWSDPAWIGGNIWNPASGESAIDYVTLSCQPLKHAETEKRPSKSRPISLEVPADIHFAPLPDNICKEEFQAVILPGSQHKPDRSKAVEMLYDGVVSTWYRSDKNAKASDRFLEIRWPSAVAVWGVRLLPHPALAPKSYKVFYCGRDDDWHLLAQQDEIGGLLEFEKVLTERLRIEFELGEGCEELGLLEMEVAGNAPRKFLKEEHWSGNFLWPLPNESGNSPTLAAYRRKFRVSDPAKLEKAMFQLSADDAWDLYLNGEKLGSGGFAVTCFDFKGKLQKGENMIAVRAENYGGPAGFLSELMLFYANGAVERIPTDDGWQCCTVLNDGWYMPDDKSCQWQRATVSPSLKEYAKKMCFHSGVNFNGNSAFSAKTVGFPKELKPGDHLHFRLQLTPQMKIAGDYGFRIILGEKALLDYCDFTLASTDLMPEKPTSAWKAGSPEFIDVNLFIPQWAPHGPQPLRIQALGADGELAVGLDKPQSVFIRRFTQEPQPKSHPVTSRIIRNGQQTRIMVGDEIMPAVIVGLNAHYTTYRSLGSMGKLQPCLLRYKPGVWKLYSNDGDDERYFKELLPGIDQTMRQMLRFFPNAKILMPLDCRINFSRTRPEEAIQMSDGQTLMYSFSSDEWRNTMIRNGSRVIRHILESDYAGNIAGFIIVTGAGGETMHYGYAANRGDVLRKNLVFGDFSPAAQTKFRRFLRMRYKNDIGALRAAWKDENVTFENAKANPEELRRMDDLCFRDPAKGAMSMDYWEFHSDAVAEGCNEIATAFKKATNGNALIVDWGFYSFAVYPHNTASTRGGLHQIGGMSLDKVLECPDVDAIAAIQSYAGIREDTLLNTTMPAASLRENGKLFIEEFDVRTYIVDFNKTADHHTLRASETLNVMKRDFGELSARGDGCWFAGFDGYTGRESIHWYGMDDIKRLINRMNSIGRTLNRRDIRSAAEVAVFINNRDIASLDMLTAADLLHNTQSVSAYGKYKGRPCYGFKNTAIPYDLYLLHDFDKAMRRPYKLIVMLNAFYLSAEERRHIKDTLLQSDKTVLWLYAPGFADRNAGLSAANISELTGMTVNVEDKFLRNPALNVEHKGWTSHKIEAEKNAYAPAELDIGPVFRISDSAATIIGRYSHDGTPALGIKKTGGMTSIYCAVPRLTPELFRDAAEYANVHVYSKAPISLNANNHILAIHAPLGVNDGISLPSRYSVLDLFTGKVVVRDCTQVPLRLQPGETRLWYIGSEAEINSLQKELQREDESK